MTDEEKAAKTIKRLAAEKMREEIRNAVRQRMANEGISAEAVKDCMKSMVANAVGKALTGDKLNDLIVSIIRAEIDRQLGGVGVFAKLVATAIEHEAEARAKTFIKANLSIRILDGGETGGTF